MYIFWKHLCSAFATRKKPSIATARRKKNDAVTLLTGRPEITRFKGLGEISPSEFAGFIGEDMRKVPVLLSGDAHIQKLLEYYMGKNTPQRQEFIINNLRIELDTVEEILN